MNYGKGKLVYDEYWGIFVEPEAPPSNRIVFLAKKRISKLPHGFHFSIGDTVKFVTDQDGLHASAFWKEDALAIVDIQSLTAPISSISCKSCDSREFEDLLNNIGV